MYAHVQQLKKEFQTEFEDPYLIYKKCCSHKIIGEEGSFVFKTCKATLEIAAKMSGAKQANGEDSQLTEEPAYFDGMHSCFHLYKSLTMWVYHVAIRKMMLLAIMEVHQENMYYITNIFEPFQDYLGDETYERHPNFIMVDEKGANFQALEKVMGKEFVNNYTMMCQYHFMQ